MRNNLMKFLSVLLLPFYLFSQPTNMDQEPCTVKKGKKLLVLIVATDEAPIFTEGQKIWRSYMHLDPDHVEAYFVKANPDLATDYLIEGDIIWCKTSNTLSPGIINKTLLAFECLRDRLKEFDYLLRTSATVFCAFPRLLKFLETLPSSKCFCGPQQFCGDLGGGHHEWGGFYYGGPLLLFSIDLIEEIMKSKDLLFNNTYYYDDALISLFLFLKRIPMIHTPMMIFPNIYWWWVNKDVLPEQIFYFRVDHYSLPPDPAHPTRSIDEVYVLRELAKKFYNVSCPLEIDKVSFEIHEAIWRSQRRPWGIWENEVFVPKPQG